MKQESIERELRKLLLRALRRRALVVWSLAVAVGLLMLRRILLLMLLLRRILLVTRLPTAMIAGSRASRRILIALMVALIVTLAELLVAWLLRVVVAVILVAIAVLLVAITVARWRFALLAVPAHGAVTDKNEHNKM